MGRSQNSFIKNQKAQRKKKKRMEKIQKKIDKKEQDTSGAMEDMIAYVDEFGNISDTPPEEEKKDKKESKSDAEEDKTED